MHSRLLACAALAAFAMPGAVAAKETIVQGTYSILVYQGENFRGCLVNGEGEADATPVRYNYGDPFCTSQPNGKDSHLWDVHAVRNFSGYPDWVHIIKNRVNGKCLIRGNNGHAASPTLHLWGESADKTYCGFASAEELLANGQATWRVSGFEAMTYLPSFLAGFWGALQMPEYAYGKGYLTWASAHDPIPRYAGEPGDWRIAFLTQPR